MERQLHLRQTLLLAVVQLKRFGEAISGAEAHPYPLIRVAQYLALEAFVDVSKAFCGVEEFDEHRAIISSASKVLVRSTINVTRLQIKSPRLFRTFYLFDDAVGPGATHILVLARLILLVKVFVPFYD